MKKEAVGYIRVSTKGQNLPGAFGVEAQKEEITKYADANGYTIKKWFVDVISGVKDDRPALNELLFGEVTNPPTTAVIVFKNDRLARDMELFFYYVFLLEKKGIKLLSTQEEFEEHSEVKNILRSVMAFVAEQERKNIAIRTANGRAVKAKQGGYSGGKTPYGYKPVAGKLVADETEAPVVKEIFALFDAGMSMAGIAKKLNNEGVLTRGGKSFFPATIRQIVGNRKTYEGYYSYAGSEWVKGSHEALIEEDLLV